MKCQNKVNKIKNCNSGYKVKFEKNSSRFSIE